MFVQSGLNFYKTKRCVGFPARKTELTTSGDQWFSVRHKLYENNSIGDMFDEFHKWLANNNISLIRLSSNTGFEVSAEIIGVAIPEEANEKFQITEVEVGNIRFKSVATMGNGVEQWDVIVTNPTPAQIKNLIAFNTFTIDWRDLPTFWCEIDL